LKYVRKFFIIRECKKFQSNAIFKNFKTFSLVDEMIYAAHQEMEKLFQETFVLPLKRTQKKRRMAADAFPAHPPYTHTHTHTHTHTPLAFFWLHMSGALRFIACEGHLGVIN